METQMKKVAPLLVSAIVLVSAVALGGCANQFAKGLLRNFYTRYGREHFLWLDRQDFFGRNFYGAASYLQTVFIAEDLVAGYRQPLTAAQHDVFSARSRRG